MRQIDNMTPQEIETLHVKGMLPDPRQKPAVDPFEKQTLDAMDAATAQRLPTLKLALDQAFLAGVSFGLKQQSK